MRKLNILKTLIDLFFFFAIIATAAMVICIPLIIGGAEIPIKIKGQEIDTMDLSAKILLAFTLMSGLFFIYAIYLFRKVIGFFMARDIFNELAIQYFNKIGICLVAYSLLTGIPLFFYNIIHKGSVDIEVSGGGFDSLLLSLSLGLFFMVLGEVFKIAKNLKEENELTV